MKLLDRMRGAGLRRHLSPLTIECYQRRVRAFLVFCADRATAPAEDDPFDFPIVLLADGSGAPAGQDRGCYRLANHACTTRRARPCSPSRTRSSPPPY